MAKNDLLLLIMLGVVIILVIIIILQYRGMHIYNGVLNIDTSDPERDLYTIVLNDHFDDIQNKKHIKLKVEKSREERSL